MTGDVILVQGNDQQIYAILQSAGISLHSPIPSAKVPLKDQRTIISNDLKRCRFSCDVTTDQFKSLHDTLTQNDFPDEDQNRLAADILTLQKNYVQGDFDGFKFTESFKNSIIDNLKKLPNQYHDSEIEFLIYVSRYFLICMDNIKSAAAFSIFMLGKHFVISITTDCFSSDRKTTLLISSHFPYLDEQITLLQQNPESQLLNYAAASGKINTTVEGTYLNNLLNNMISEEGTLNLTNIHNSSYRTFDVKSLSKSFTATVTPFKNKKAIKSRGKSNDDADFFAEWIKETDKIIINEDLSLEQRLLYADFKTAIQPNLEKIKPFSNCIEREKAFDELSKHLQPINELISKINSPKLNHAIGCLLSLIYGTIAFNKAGLDPKILTNFIRDILCLSPEDIPKKLEHTCKKLENDIAKTILRALVTMLLLISVVGIPVLLYQKYKPQNCMSLFKRSPAGEVLREQVAKYIPCNKSPEQNTFNQEPFAPQA